MSEDCIFLQNFYREGRELGQFLLSSCAVFSVKWVALQDENSPRLDKIEMLGASYILDHKSTLSLNHIYLLDIVQLIILIGVKDGPFSSSGTGGSQKGGHLHQCPCPCYQLVCGKISMRTVWSSDLSPQ